MDQVDEHHDFNNQEDDDSPQAAHQSSKKPRIRDDMGDYEYRTATMSSQAPEQQTPKNYGSGSSKSNKFNKIGSSQPSKIGSFSMKQHLP